MRKSSLFLRILFFLVGILALAGSACSIYHGHISVGRHAHHVYTRATDPNVFWFYVILYAIIGAFCIYLSFRDPEE